MWVFPEFIVLQMQMGLESGGMGRDSSGGDVTPANPGKGQDHHRTLVKRPTSQGGDANSHLCPQPFEATPWGARHWLRMTCSQIEGPACGTHRFPGVMFAAEAVLSLEALKSPWVGLTGCTPAGALAGVRGGIPGKPSSRRVGSLIGLTCVLGSAVTVSTEDCTPTGAVMC